MPWRPFRARRPRQEPRRLAMDGLRGPCGCQGLTRCLALACGLGGTPARLAMDGSARRERASVAARSAARGAKRRGTEGSEEAPYPMTGAECRTAEGWRRSVRSRDPGDGWREAGRGRPTSYGLATRRAAGAGQRKPARWSLRNLAGAVLDGGGRGTGAGRCGPQARLPGAGRTPAGRQGRRPAREALARAGTPALLWQEAPPRREREGEAVGVDGRPERGSE